MARNASRSPSLIAATSLRTTGLDESWDVMGPPPRSYGRMASEPDADVEDDASSGIPGLAGGSPIWVCETFTEDRECADGDHDENSGVQRLLRVACEDRRLPAGHHHAPVRGWRLHAQSQEGD